MTLGPGNRVSRSAGITAGPNSSAWIDGGGIPAKNGARSMRATGPERRLAIKEAHLSSRAGL
jgi:hypothetical protein